MLVVFNFLENEFMEHQIFFEAVAQIIPTLLIAILLGSRFPDVRGNPKHFFDFVMHGLPFFVIFTFVLMGEVVVLSVLWNGVYREEQLQFIIGALIFAGLIIVDKIFSFISPDRKSLGYIGILIVAGFIIWRYLS